jgi:hypothetical protein
MDNEEDIQEAGGNAGDVKNLANEEEMCCKGDGTTASQHRHESEDGKCCIDK